MSKIVLPVHVAQDTPAALVVRTAELRNKRRVAGLAPMPLLGLSVGLGAPPAAFPELIFLRGQRIAAYDEETKR